MIRFTWDDDKNALNIAKHGVDFADAYRAFGRPMLVALDAREDYGEDRWIGIGMLDERVATIVGSEADDGSVRVISLSKALSQEQRSYEEYLQDELGAG